jgi:hypothetical protein
VVFVGSGRGRVSGWGFEECGGVETEVWLGSGDGVRFAGVQRPFAYVSEGGGVPFLLTVRVMRIFLEYAHWV